MAEDFDISEFYDIFYEECQNNLETLEQGLLNLTDQSESEEVHTIFRAAHSIKGGAGSFGFPEVASYTHVLESVLGAMREGKLLVTQEVIDVLLEATDMLKEMLANLKDSNFDSERKDRVIEALQSVFDSNDDKSVATQAPIPQEPAPIEANTTQAPVAHELDATTPTSDASAAESEPLSAAAPTQESKVAKPAPAAGAAAESSLRVRTEKIDELINQVGELVITQSMLSQLANTFGDVIPPAMRVGIEQLSRNSREIQESVMQVRMLPISFAFSRFPRLVRDLSRKLGKKVELIMEGESTELDKTVLEAIGDPLVHLVRNALDHGIETIDERANKGKSPQGVISLRACHEGGNILIEIEDDGAGIDSEKLLAKAKKSGILNENDNIDDNEVLNLIFHPGLSTAEKVSDISGRGVGMDVVRRNIRDLGGTVSISSSLGEGSKISVRLPLTLAIIDGQLVRVGEAIYIFPLLSVIETIPFNTAEVQNVGGNRSSLIHFRDEFVPLIALSKLFPTKNCTETPVRGGLVVMVESFGNRVGLKVDELLSQQQVVIKSLDTNLYAVPGLMGATILGDGRVALIIDIPGVISSLTSVGDGAREVA